MEPFASEFCEIADASAASRELLADLFHALNQPLAALRCSCELALLAPRTSEQYRDCLETAVQKTEQASQLAKGIREWLEAGDGAEEEEKNHLRPPLSLRAQLRETVEHFWPAASEVGTTFSVDDGGDCSPDDSLVEFHPEHLRRALFYIFDCTLALAKEKNVSIHLGSSPSQVTLRLSFLKVNAGGAPFTAQPNRPQEKPASHSNWQTHWQPKLQWAIAQRLFRASHGSLVMTSREGESCVHAILPLAGRALGACRPR